MLLLVILAMTVLAIMGCAPNTTGTNDGDKALKVGFVYIGPPGDGGYTYAHDQGALYMQEKLGVDVVKKESVPEDASVKKVMQDMIDQGCTVIFTTSYGYMEYTLEMAKEHPDIKFLHCSGYRMHDNMSNYFGRIYQARYLTGIVAGMKTESNKIGYVAAFGIPEVVRGLNAFTLGVRSVNPEAEVHVRWTKTWYDPAKEKDAAIALLDEGCDVIGQHQDTPGPQQAAEERGKWAIGYNSDMSAAAPNANMTSAVWNWGPFYERQVKAVMDGTWKSESYWGGFEDGIVNVAPLTKNAPDGAQAKIDSIIPTFKDKSFEPFTGPLNDNTGTQRVAPGVKMTDDELLSFDWLIEGVIGNLNDAF